MAEDIEDIVMRERKEGREGGSREGEGREEGGRREEREEGGRREEREEGGRREGKKKLEDEIKEESGSVMISFKQRVNKI